MKISGSTPNYINQTYANQNNAASNPNLQTKTDTDEARGDNINLSSTTRDLQKIDQAMENDSVETERQQKVADLRQQVQAGQYTVNAEQVAEKMIGSVMDELG